MAKAQAMVAPRPWIKLWILKLHDHRFLRLNEIERYRYWGLCLCQAQGFHDYYQSNPDELLKSISVQLGVDAGQMHDSILRMRTLRLVDHEFRIMDWDAEQARYVKDSTAAERQRRRRERKRESRKALPAPDSAQTYEDAENSASRRHAVTSRGRRRRRRSL